MPVTPVTGYDRRRTLAVAEDAQRIANLAQEFQRNARELEEQARKLRGTLGALESANDELDRRAGDMAATQAIADAATARLARLQSITAAVSNSVTFEGVADVVLREAIVALECDAGAVVMAAGEHGRELVLLGEEGSLDALLRSFTQVDAAGPRGPYADAMEQRRPIYIESFGDMVLRYPAFRSMFGTGLSGAWMFLPLEIDGIGAGALAFGFSGPRTFSMLDQQFADTVSRYCAQAMDRVKLRVEAAAALAEARDARLLAEHANNAKSEFLRAMSHDLRTPLNSISGYAELLELGIRGEVNAEQLKDLGRIRRAASYLLGLINDVLTVARNEGARPLSTTATVVDGVLTEIEELCELQAQSKGITLSISLSESQILVATDAQRLRQILLNLVTNAIKFTGRDGTIDVTCASDGGAVRIRVKDTGIGIAPADVDRVFDPFVQINRHLTPSTQQGIGLGLSISRDLARAMRGDLTLESVEGVGSEFTLTLPMAIDDALIVAAPAVSLASRRRAEAVS